MKIRLEYIHTGYVTIKNVTRYEFDSNTNQLKIWYNVGSAKYIKYIFARELREYTAIGAYYE